MANRPGTPRPAPARSLRPLLELFPPSAQRPAPSPPRQSHDHDTTRTLVASMPMRPVESSAYETFYGLSEPPFALAFSDLKFLYHGSAHDRAAQAMLAAVRRREGVVLLTGEMGIGKTMLCQAVVDRLDRHTLISFISEPFESAGDLLRRVLGDFGVISRAELAAGRLRDASREELSSALRDFLSSLAPLQAFAVVIIDEAQDLPADVLDEIRQLADAEGNERRLQVVLVGQPGLEATLARRQLRRLAQRISERWTLGPLTADEIPGYIRHRLSVAGGSRVEFDAQATQRIFEISRGVPRTVNVLCDRALSAGHRVSASGIDERLIRTASEDLELAVPRRSRASTFGAVALVSLLVLVAGVGAGMAAYVLRDELATVMHDWQRIPPPPVVPAREVPPLPVIVPPPTP